MLTHGPRVCLPISCVMTGGPPTFMTEFHVFTAIHFVTLAACFALIIGACAIGRRCGVETAGEKRLRRAWAWFILAAQVPSNYYYIALHWDLQNSLPLHLCDLAVIVAGFALLLEARWLRTLLYFWGLGLSTQGFITPVVQEGVAHPRFWYFWLNHLQIVGSAVYLLVVLRYRPRWRDAALAWAITLVYAGVMVAFNLAFETNYGFVGNLVPETPTIIDKLGPWPERVFMLVGIVTAWFAVLWAVWPVARMIGGRGEAPGGSAAPGSAS